VKLVVAPFDAPSCLGRVGSRHDADACEISARPGEAGDEAPPRPGHHRRKRRSASSRSRFSRLVSRSSWPRRSPRPYVRRARRRMLAAGRNGPPPSGIRSRHFVPRYNRSRPVPGERSDGRCIRPWCVIAKETDYRQTLLLRSHLPDCSPKHQSDREIAPSHSKTSWARARIDGGILRPSAWAVLRLTTSSKLVDCWTGCRRVAAGQFPPALTHGLAGHRSLRG
jgi:hypothetical protein